MTALGGVAGQVPLDPTFSPAAYERVARLLRTGVVVFLLFAGAGMIAQLVLNPSEDTGSLLSSNPVSDYRTLGTFVGDLASGNPGALILLGIFVMVGVTVGRVLLATIDFYRGGERALGAVSVVVIVLLIVALFVVGPFVR